MEVLFLQTPYYCQACKKKVNEGVTFKRCSGCQCAHYCDQVCQRADWSQHKKYCKMLAYVKECELPAFKQAKGCANKEASDKYKAALQAAQGTPAEGVYQKALMYTDLNAQKLMECLLARPQAGEALTQALQDVKFVQIRGDSYDHSKRLIDRYLALVAGLEVDSQFDRWPVGPGGQGGCSTLTTGDT